MSVDTMLFALTEVQRVYRKSEDAYSPDTKARLIDTIDVLRSYLLKEDVEGFSACVDRLLAREPDLADEILECLFECLGVSVREEFDAALHS